MELGAKIKALRAQRGLSQEALAEKLEVSRQAIAKWESGQSKPSTANLLALCGVFGVSPDALVSGETVQNDGPPEPDRRQRRPGRAVLAVLPALTLLSLGFSIAVTTTARNMRFPEQVIGGADGPTSIFISGPYILGLPPEAFPLWLITAVLAAATVIVFLRERNKR